MSATHHESGLDRRSLFFSSAAAIAGAAFLKGPMALAGSAVDDQLPSPEADMPTPGLVPVKKGKKPVYLAQPDNQDIVTLTVAEHLFWNDALMEHAQFFTMLMPGERLKSQRMKADRFRSRFGLIIETVRQKKWSQGDLPGLNAKVGALVKEFIIFKQDMRERQEKGELRSLVWPSFFEHTQHEAERFLMRLKQLSAATVAYNFDEVMNFWTEIMAEHGEFIAHLLDPKERELMMRANSFAEKFYAAHLQPVSFTELTTLADDVIDFKMAAEQGINSGTIKSIIDPALADHVLREAVKFSDEVRRSAQPTP